MRSLLLVLSFLSACSLQQTQASADNVGADAAARYLAGMASSNGWGFAGTRDSRQWDAYSIDFERRWKSFADQQLHAAHSFSARHIRSKHPVAYYMFSGPDFPFVNSFFPDATVYVLSGREQVGDPARLQEFARFDSTLNRLRASLAGYFKLGFFKTEDMQPRRQFAGITPLLMALIARSGNHLQTVELFHLRDDGELIYNGFERGEADGLKIAFVDPRAKTKVLYYFNVDLANGGKSSAAFLRFCRAMGDGDMLLKSASYLLHEDDFSDLRGFVLEHAKLLVQDDTGIPVRYLKPDDWNLSLFGKYQTPLGQFEKYHQPELASMPQPAGFRTSSLRTGYLGQLGGSNLLLAKRRGDP